MRTSVIPPATGDGVTAYVGGVTAANVDLAAKISSQLVELVLVVLALSIVLLLVAFRSLLIPPQRPGIELVHLRSPWAGDSTGLARFADMMPPQTDPRLIRNG